jgi:hypothetical protein
VARSITSRSTDRAVSRRPARPGVDVYLLPAIVGGGLGDIDEVLCAGRYLSRAGFPVTLYRPAGRPLPTAVDGRWDWAPVRRRSTLAPRAAKALTVTPAWGITAAPPRDEALGRAGPWAEEASAIEARYGPDRTVHVSLEEFARVLPAREEAVERLREGGVPAREIPERLADPRAEAELAVWRQAFRRFRAFDRTNVLHLFAAFRYDRRFAREFPEAVQVGPLWPGLGGERSGRPDRARWVWYASPASAEEIAPAVGEGLAGVPLRPWVEVRTDRAWRRPSPSARIAVRAEPLGARAWRRSFRRASLRIVTGSRTLLEALELGGPFLYFNGVLGGGRRRRRHRPEKIAQLLAVARRAGWPDDLLADLDAFARGRRVAEVVRRAAAREGGWRRFPSRPDPVGFAPGFQDAGDLLVRVARRLAATDRPSSELVAELRRAAHG